MQLREIQVEPASLFREIDEFGEFLKTNPRAERVQFLPFFAAHLQLCAHLGELNDRVLSVTHVGTEVSLWGDFSCDVVAGSRRDGAFVFMEFEDASETSLFRRQRGRKNSHWGTRVEHGISQIVDWLFRINSEPKTELVSLPKEPTRSYLCCPGVVKTCGTHSRVISAPSGTHWIGLGVWMSPYSH